MSYLIPNIIFSLTATFLLGLLIGWVIWGRLKSNLVKIENDWQHQYKNLDAKYQSATTKLAEMDKELNNRAAHIDALNIEKNKLSEQVNTSETLALATNTEIEQLKNLLGQTTARLHVTSDELKTHKHKLGSLRENSSDVDSLKALLGKATKKYNENNLELKNKQEEVTTLHNKFDETRKQNEALNEQIKALRAKLNNREKEFEIQIVDFTHLKNELSEKNEALSNLQIELDAQKDNVTISTELQQRDEIITALQQDISELSGLQKSFESRESEILELQKALEHERSRIPNLENSIKKRDASILALNTEITKLSNEIPQLRDNLEKSENLIIQQKQELKTLEQKIPALKNTISARNAHIHELEKFIKDAQKAILKPANKTVASNGNGNGIANGNGHINESNRGNIFHINGNGKNISKVNGNTQTTLVKSTTVSNNKASNGSPTKQKIKSYGLKKASRKPDDLKLISGIGIALEKTLHKCGIFYFEQIAGFSRKDVTTVDDMLNFKGRIDRDEWIKQAKILMRGGTYTRKKTTHKPSKRRIKPMGMKRPSGVLDDLQLINGVGPKLERKLHRLGVYHFEQIAEFTAKDIEVLDSKLKTYKGRVKRDKWTTQARKLHKEFHSNQ